MPSIVDQIRKALEQRNGISIEIMSPLAAAYSDEVLLVNQRLGEAVALLRKGLRSEAIQRANLNPNAIEAAANLDFPEVGEWTEILQFLGVAVPPAIDHDAARQLNEAIVETQPLNELLNRHRKLAIAKAPLSWRLKVLRRIAEVDPMNPLWEEDLEVWEAARLKQVPLELKQAIKDQNRPAVFELRDELTQNAWRIPPAKRLLQEANEAATQFEYEDNTEQLNAIAPQLHDAFGQFDEATARSLREQWRGIQNEMSAPPPVDLADQVAPALAWLEELDRDAALRQQRGSAIGRLQLALDQNEGLSDLHRAYQGASRFDEPLPSELEQRYRVSVADLELKSRRRSQAIVVAIVAATLLIATTIGYWQWNRKFGQQLAETTTQMESLLEQGKLKEASEFLQRIESSQPKIATHSRMASLASQLNGLLSDESTRAAEFNSYLEKSKSDNPESIDTAALNKAESLAKTEEEQAAAFAVRRVRTQWERDLHAKQNSLALQRLENLRKQLDRIEANGVDSDSIEAVTVLVTEVAAVSREYPSLSSSTNAQIDLLKSRASAMRDSMHQQSLDMRTRSAAFKRLLESGSLSVYASNLSAFVRDVPTSPLAKEFEEVAKEEPLWQRALRSNSIMAQLRTSIPGGISPPEAQTLLATHNQLSNDTSANPLLGEMPTLVTDLERVRNRESLFEKIFQDLALQTVAELVTMKAFAADAPETEIRRFVYFSHFDQFRDRFKINGRVGIEVVVNESAAVQKSGFIGPVKIIPEPRDTVRWLLNNKTDNRKRFLSDWNGAFLETAAELRKRPDLDGVIKEMLLLKLLVGASEGSEFLDTSLAYSIKYLNRRGEARRRWYTPQPLSSDLHPDVERIVIPEMSSAYQQRGKEWQHLQKVMSLELKWLGCLLRNHTGGITAQVKHSPQESAGDVFVVGPSATSPEKIDITKVGVWKQDHVELSSSHRALVAGRPLFFVSSAR